MVRHKFRNRLPSPDGLVPVAARLIDRHMRAIVNEALQDSRAWRLGARQVGKSTLAGEVARNELGATEFNLDDEPTRRAAISDPVGFVAAIDGPAVIDEIGGTGPPAGDEGAHGRRPTPGQFLITGSANLLALATIHDRFPAG